MLCKYAIYALCALLYSLFVQENTIKDQKSTKV